MRRIRINSAAVSPGKYDNAVDEEFMEDVGSIITLEDGSSLNLKQAVLLYNPKTKKIQLTDSDNYPNDYVQVASLTVTDQKPEPDDSDLVEPEIEPESPEESEEETEEDTSSTDESSDDRLGKTAGPPDSADFFQ